MLKIKIVHIVVLVGSCLVAISESKGGVHGCLKKFDNEKDLTKAVNDCVTSLNLNTTLPKYEEYANANFDDKCLGKCILTALELILENGSLDKDSMLDMIEAHAPKILINKLTEATAKCATSSGIEKVEKKDDCKPYGNFQGCYLTATDNLC